MNSKKVKKIRQMIRKIAIDSNTPLPWTAYQRGMRKMVLKDANGKALRDENGDKRTIEAGGTIKLTDKCDKYWVQVFKKLETPSHGKPHGPLKVLPEIVNVMGVLRQSARAQAAVAQA